MLGAPLSVGSIRLWGISGYNMRINDIVYCHPSVKSDTDTAVVFFGGDLQDFRENMECHNDNKSYVKWDLETTAELLHTCFPDSHIVVIKPSRMITPKLATFMEFVSADVEQHRMEFNTFSCFDNFVPSNNFGSPNHTPTYYALHHLEKLLQETSLRLKSMRASDLLNEMKISQPTASSQTGEKSDKENHVEKKSTSTSKSEAEEDEKDTDDEDEELESEILSSLWWRERLNLDKAELVIVGFSKGCVVLNQFLYEFHYLKTLTPDDDTMMRLVSRIQHMYWLDGGHAGNKNTWITSRSLLETVTRLGIGIHIHVTPYQIQDEKRPWIRKEEKMFSDLLKQLGALVQRTVHFENVAPSINTHFEVLSAFKQPEN